MIQEAEISPTRRWGVLDQCDHVPMVEKATDFNGTMLKLLTLRSSN